MLSIGKPPTPRGAVKYFKDDFASRKGKADAAQKQSKDYSEGETEEGGAPSLESVVRKAVDPGYLELSRTSSLWFGKLAEEFGLSGPVTKKEFSLFCDGRHPKTGEQLIRHVKPRTVTKENGKTFQTKARRAGLDQTINAPKSVSLVAIEDPRVIQAHWLSALKTIEELEKFSCAKMGNNKQPELTGKACYAVFIHFDSRPDSATKFAAPELHTHNFKFNLLFDQKGQPRAEEIREIYASQKFATAVYRAELIREMRKIGYEMEINQKTGAPEVVGISRELIEACSPRQKEIKKKAEELGIKSTKTVAANYRQSKNFDREEMRRSYLEIDDHFGNQAKAVADQARQRTREIELSVLNLSFKERELSQKVKSEKAREFAGLAITKAREQKHSRNARERKVSWQSLMADSLNFAKLEITIEEVKAEFAVRYGKGELDEFNLKPIKLTRGGNQKVNSRFETVEKSLPADHLIKDDHQLAESINEPLLKTVKVLEQTNVNYEQPEQLSNAFRQSAEQSVNTGQLDYSYQPGGNFEEDKEQSFRISSSGSQQYSRRRNDELGKSSDESIDGSQSNGEFEFYSISNTGSERVSQQLERDSKLESSKSSQISYRADRCNSGTEIIITPASNFKSAEQPIPGTAINLTESGSENIGFNHGNGETGFSNQQRNSGNSGLKNETLNQPNPENDFTSAGDLEYIQSGRGGDGDDTRGSNPIVRNSKTDGAKDRTNDRAIRETNQFCAPASSSKSTNDLHKDGNDRHQSRSSGQQSERTAEDAVDSSAQASERATVGEAARERTTAISNTEFINTGKNIDSQNQYRATEQTNKTDSGYNSEQISASNGIALSVVPQIQNANSGVPILNPEVVDNCLQELSDGERSRREDGNAFTSTSGLQGAGKVVESADNGKGSVDNSSADENLDQRDQSRTIGSTKGEAQQGSSDFSAIEAFGENTSVLQPECKVSSVDSQSINNTVPGDSVNSLAGTTPLAGSDVGFSSAGQPGFDVADDYSFFTRKIFLVENLGQQPPYNFENINSKISPGELDAFMEVPVQPGSVDNQSVSEIYNPNPSVAVVDLYADSQLGSRNSPLETPNQFLLQPLDTETKENLYNLYSEEMNENLAQVNQAAQSRSSMEEEDLTLGALDEDNSDIDPNMDPDMLDEIRRELDLERENSLFGL